MIVSLQSVTQKRRALNVKNLKTLIAIWDILISNVQLLLSYKLKYLPQL